MRRLFRAALSCNSLRDIWRRQCRPPESPDGWRYKEPRWPRDLFDPDGYTATWYEQSSAPLRFVKMKPVDGGWAVSVGEERTDYEEWVATQVPFEEAVAVARDAMETVGPGTTMEEVLRERNSRISTT